ncbi:hypothetical protein EXIGLDRAFT_722573 [Exidia glandulosa HHB12029]|uniref:Glutathione S-transferase n=1 Tax=Exidia glandulosa HHB12029 TaxID=1314781 RepID=A0A165F911_EXIGL|nr:hypothetical protein EXIGLDRAFT_722573 [Exidia glandulosa HHB12029]
MSTYELFYFPSPGLADLQRMMLDVSGASYTNTFVDFSKWPEVKPTMAFGVVPKLTIHEADGTRKELFESAAIDAYLAEVLDFFPGSSNSPFDRAEALSVRSALCELEEKIRPSLWLPDLDARKAGHATYLAETVPKFLKYQECFVRGDWYFGDKMTIADLKLYQLYVWYDTMYTDQNPFKVHVSEYPKLNKIIAALDKGKAGDYVRNRRDFGKLPWVAEEWKFVPKFM